MRFKSSRARTGDRGPPEGAPEIYTVEQLGPKRARTPNGNLICYDVPIARVGMLLYKEGEIPLEGDERGVIRVYRSAEELFNDKTIGSFMGVAVTDEHPESMEVTPSTWKEEAYGFSTTNVRRGEGDDADVLFADLIITDDDLIRQILAGKVEVSAGYEADYEQTGPGEGIQVNIIGNHIALVERGRCGPRCAIGDHDPFTKGNEMTIRKRLTTEQKATRMRALVGDMEALLEDGSDPPDDGGSSAGTEKGGETHIHIHAGGGGGEQVLGDQPAMPNTLSQDGDPNAMGADPNAPAGGNLEARIGALEAMMKKLMAMLGGGGSGDEAPDPEGGDPDAAPGDDPTGELGEEGEDIPTKDELPEELDIEAQKTGDELPVKENIVAHKTGDSAALGKAYQQLLADVEIIAPGMKVPTFDSKATRAKTVDRMCSIRRRALSSYAGTEDGAAIMGAGATALDDMDCAGVASLFKTSAAAQRVLNNRKVTGDSHRVADQEQAQRPVCAADINKANAEFWAGRTH